jgi:N-dimethylarginine dimethylaminohydrolase
VIARKEARVLFDQVTGNAQTTGIPAADAAPGGVNPTLATSPQASAASGQPAATTRHFLMCRPTHFDVTYMINPWMNPNRPVNRARAISQWEALRTVYTWLGHQVSLIEPAPSLPDMVFAANGATVINGIVLGARFLAPQRRPEGERYLDWFRDHGYPDARTPTYVNEGEGDYLFTGTHLLAGTGFRTDPRSHGEAAELFGVPVVPLRLVDPRFYHLDTALCVLDQHNVMYNPCAFAPESQRTLRRLYPDAVIATAADAAKLGLNAVSDGRNVVLAAAAVDLARQLRDRGYQPVPVDVSELLRAGGGVKCATLELRERVPSG